MKKEPKAVYILENGKYTELSYAEFCCREQACPAYADKLFLPLHGRLMEVSAEDYKEFYRQKNRQRYLDRRSAENGDFSYDMLTTDAFNGEDILTAPADDIVERLSLQRTLEELRRIVRSLPEDERKLIVEHFYSGIPQTELARKYGIHQSNISRRLGRILTKIRKMIEN